MLSLWYSLLELDLHNVSEICVHHVGCPLEVQLVELLVSGVEFYPAGLLLCLLGVVAPVDLEHIRVLVQLAALHVLEGTTISTLGKLPKNACPAYIFADLKQNLLLVRVDMVG